MIQLITGGAGFVGTNLIKFFLNKTNYYIISIDDYSSGFKKNHLKNKRVKYIKGSTKDISKLIKRPGEIKTVFHFGEFARIYQSFLKMNECIESNSVGLLENLKKWFNFKYEIIYFYNVYGPHQICTGQMSTVIGIFEDHYKKRKSLPVVRPGTQTRRFTHIDDTIKICYLAWKKNLCRHYSISNKKSYSILEVARLFKSKIKFLPKRAGERHVSALTDKNLSNKIYKYFGKISLKNYIQSFIKNI